MVSTIGAALAPNYSGYMAARFFQGLGVSPASNVGLAVITDIFFEHERGQKIGLWVLAIDLGLLFGPLVGGFVNIAGYTWIQWLSAILLSVILLLELIFLPETLYARDLLYLQTQETTPAATEQPLDDKRANFASSTINISTSTTPRYVPRTRRLSMFNIKPLQGTQHPKPYDTLIRFLKSFQLTVVPITIVTYCFGWYWWVLSIVTLVPVAYPTYSTEIQG